MILSQDFSGRIGHWAGIPIFVILLAAPVAPAQVLETGTANQNTSCPQLQGELGSLYTSLAIPEQQQAAARQMVRDEVGKGMTPAEAHGRLMAGAMLLGDYRLAAGAAAHAGQQDWDANAMANVGVNLFYLRRFDDAERFLRCAAKLDPDSPFPLEALALIALERKDLKNAVQLVDRALQRLQGDSNILYTAGVIHMKAGDVAAGRRYLWQALDQHPGNRTFEAAARAADPGGAEKPKKPPGKDIDTLIADTFEYFDALLKRGEEAAARATKLQKIKFPDSDFPPYTATDLRDEISEAKETINITREALRSVEQSRPSRTVLVSMHNSLVVTVANEFSDLYFDEWMDLVNDVDPQFLLLAATMREPAERVAAYWMPPENSHTSPNYLWRGGLHKFDLTRDEATVEANAVYKQCVDSHKPNCDVPANRVFCEQAKPGFQAMLPIVRAQLDTAVGGFPAALRAEHLLIRAVIAEVQDRTKYIFSYLQPIPAGPAAASEAAVIRATQDLINAQLSGFVQIRVVISEVLYENLANDIIWIEHQIESSADEIVERCRDSKQDAGNRSFDEEVDAVLAALRDSTTITSSDAFECEVTLPFVEFKLTPPNEGWVPKVEYTFKESAGPVTMTRDPATDRRGIEVGKDVTVGTGVIAKGGVKFIAESGGGRPPDFRAEIGGKIGVGGGAGPLSGGCYTASLSASVSGRAFAGSYLGGL